MRPKPLKSKLLKFKRRKKFKLQMKNYINIWQLQPAHRKKPLTLEIFFNHVCMCTRLRVCACVCIFAQGHIDRHRSKRKTKTMCATYGRVHDTRSLVGWQFFIFHCVVCSSVSIHGHGLCDGHSSFAKIRELLPNILRISF